MCYDRKVLRTVNIKNLIWSSYKVKFGHFFCHLNNPLLILSFVIHLCYFHVNWLILAGVRWISQKFYIGAVFGGRFLVGAVFGLLATSKTKFRPEWFNFELSCLEIIILAYCIESLLQPFSNWKFNWGRRDLNVGPSKHQSNALPTELSWLDWMEEDWYSCKKLTNFYLSP